MKKIAFILFASILTLTSCEQQQKIVYVDNVQLYKEYQEKIDIEERFTQKQEDFKKKTDSLQQAYQLEAIALQNKLGKLSPKQQENSTELQGFQQKWQVVDQQIKAQEQALATEYEEKFKLLDSHIEEFLGTYAKEKGYAYILGKSKTGAVMYGDSLNDVTTNVVKAINENYKGDTKETATSEEPTEE